MKTLSIGTEITAHVDSKGQILTGKIDKLNRTTCTIICTGGNTRFTVGHKVKCPYSLITVPFKCGERGIELTHVVATGSSYDGPKFTTKFVPDEWFVRNNINALIMLGQVFSDMSPENLSCDGEASAAWINKRRKEINSRYTVLSNMIGQDLDETQFYDMMGKYWEAAKAQLEEDAKNCESWYKPWTSKNSVTESAQLDAMNGV